MPRLEPELADARDRAQAIINLELRRYSRRLKQAAEDHISGIHAEAAVSGLVFDHRAAADEAVEHARSMYFAGELPSVTSDSE